MNARKTLSGTTSVPIDPCRKKSMSRLDHVGTWSLSILAAFSNASAFTQSASMRSVIVEQIVRPLYLRNGKRRARRAGQIENRFLLPACRDVIYLSNLTGAEYSDAFIDVKDVTTVIIRTGDGRCCQSLARLCLPFFLRISRMPATVAEQLFPGRADWNR
jgi:hypothetical protein